MTSFPESGIKLIADTDSYVQAMEEAIQLASEFDAISELSITVTADTSEATSALEDLPLSDENVDFTVDVSQTGDDVTDVTSLTDETVTETVDVVKTDTANETLSAVQKLANLKTLETIWNITGTAVDIAQKIGSFAAAPLLSLDEAIAKVNAQTNSTITDVGGIIKGVFYDDLGTSIDQVGQIVIKAQQMKLPVEEATRAALEFTHTFTDQNPEQVLDAISSMLKNGLAPNATQAGDMLVKAFQDGANKGNDLLQAINNNATAINGLGLTGPQALSFIKTGMDNGFKSANDVIGALEKIKQNVTNAAGNATSDVTKTLNLLGIANPAETGEAWSADFFKKVIEGIQNQPGLSDTQKEVLFTNLIGGKQGGKTFAAFMKLSPDDADFALSELEGASKRAAAKMDDSLAGAIGDFELAIQKAVVDYLSSANVDLPGKITALKEGLQSALNTLSEGGTLGEALTIALKPIGFDDEFSSLEAMLGNFVIAILQVVSSIQSLNPDSWAAKAGTDATIAKMSETQLTFDLKVGNPDDIATEISTAVSRGVSPDKITASVGQAINELIADGSEAALAKAQALIDTLNKPVDMNNVPLLANGTPMNVEPVVTTEALDGFQAQIDAAKPVTVKVAPDPDSAFMDSLIPMAESTSGLGTTADTATQSIDALNVSTATQTTKATTAAPIVKTLADNTQAQGDAASSAVIPVGDVALQLNSIGAIAPTAASGLSGVVVALQAILDKANAVGVAASSLAQKNADADANAGSKPVKPHAVGTSSTGIGTFMAGEKGRELVTTNQDLAVLNNMTTESIMAAIRGYTPGGSFSSKGGSTNIINNNNYVPSQAVADSLGFSQAKTLRGQG